MTTETSGKPASRASAKAIVAAVLAVLCLVIFFQNLQPAKVQLFFWSVSMAQIVLMFLMLLIGFVLGWILATSRRSRQPKA